MLVLLINIIAIFSILYILFWICFSLYYHIIIFKRYYELEDDFYKNTRTKTKCIICTNPEKFTDVLCKSCFDDIHQIELDMISNNKELEYDKKDYNDKRFKYIHNKRTGCLVDIVKNSNKIPHIYKPIVIKQEIENRCKLKENNNG